jgi:serine/threonine protein kinase
MLFCVKYLLFAFAVSPRWYLMCCRATGGELLDRILTKGSYSEDEARRVCREIFDAVAYLHSLGIAHRDLKARVSFR